MTDQANARMGRSGTSSIHERDVAAVAVRALLSAEYAGRTFVLTGPESLTQRDKVQLIGEAIGKDLSWEEISPDQVRQAMTTAQGLPADVPERLLGSLADYARPPGPSSANPSTPTRSGIRRQDRDCKSRNQLRS
jgi:uncharacterized protein YbjT (DUF2867 family)